MSNSVAHFIENELRKVADRHPTAKRDGIWIRCPNPAHSHGMERTPSCRIRTQGKYAGKFKCYGCHETGDWNKLADWMKLAKLDLSIDNSHEGTFSFRRHSREINDDEEDWLDLDHKLRWPATESWRGISGDTLRNTFDAHLIKRRDEYRLLLPVYRYKKLVGSIEALMREPRRDKNGKKEMTYVNSKGAWSEHNLFNFNNARRKQPDAPLWIVEGPRDTANVAQHGGRVVGLMGSAVTTSKLDLIRLIDPPALIIATDNDDAGDKARGALVEELSEWYPIYHYRFKGSDDPADLTRDQIQQAIAKVKRKIAA